MDIQGQHAFFRNANHEVWRVDLSQLGEFERTALEIASKSTIATVLWDTIDRVRTQHPGAFNLQPDGAGPLPSPDFSQATSFPFDFAEADINLLVALVVNLFIQLGGEIRKTAIENSFKDIVQNLKEALNRKKTEEEAAAAEFAGAVVAAVLSMVTGVAGVAGGAKSAWDSKNDVLDRTRLDVDQRRIGPQLENAESNAADFAKSAKDMRGVAAESRAKADEAGAKANKLEDEVNEHQAKITKLNQQLEKASTSEEKVRLKKEIIAATEDVVKATAEAKAARQAQQTHLSYAEEANIQSGTLSKLADAEQKRALALRAELNQVNKDIKRKDDEIAENANLTRLISVIAPIFTSIGQMAAAYPNQDAKVLTAYANFLSAAMSGNEMEKAVQDEIAKNFLDFIHSLVDWMKSIAESNNQTLSTSARAIA